MANRTPEPAGQISRSRLPLPPVPAPARPAPAAQPPRAQSLADLIRAAEAASTTASSAEPAAPTGIRTDSPAPRVPRQTAGASDARYGDWTKPSRAGEPAADEARPATPVAAAPATSAIPERSVTRRGQDSADPDSAQQDRTRQDRTHQDPSGQDAAHDHLAEQDRSPSTGDVEEIDEPRAGRSASRTPVGGRAALRAERQAAELARKKAAKDSGVAVLDEEPRRAPRRVAKGLVAMGVVALGVLGVYQFTSPPTDEAGATRNLPAAAPLAPIAPLPELAPEAAPVEPVVSAPVRVPYVVLNATSTTGLAARISGAVEDGGWEAAGVGAYEGDDVSADTVFFEEGDETQRQAAVQLVDQFPQLQGPAPRFFELPADVPAGVLVVVATGGWAP